MKNFCCITFVCLLSFASNEIANSEELNVWIGTGGNVGIHHLVLDTETGTLSNPKIVAPLAGSGFIAMHPNGKFLYSTSKERNAGFVAAFRIKRDGKNSSLELVNSQPIDDGGAACVAVDKTGKVLMSAQYGGGSVASFKINDDGSLSPRVSFIEHGKGSGANAQRQADSHPHWTGTSPDNRFLMVPDLGKDAVVVYELNSETAELKKHSEVPLPPASGPRHMKFSLNGKFAYVLNEFTLTICVFKYDAESAAFESIQEIETLPQEKKDKFQNSAAEIRVHPAGRFIYSSNRGHDSISVFSVDLESGKLELVEREHIRGSIPRNFNLDPSGNWLIAGGQASNTVALFEVDSKTGALTFNRQVVNAPNPICFLFDLPN